MCLNKCLSAQHTSSIIIRMALQFDFLGLLLGTLNLPQLHFGAVFSFQTDNSLALVILPENICHQEEACDRTTPRLILWHFWNYNFMVCVNILFYRDATMRKLLRKHQISQNCDFFLIHLWQIILIEERYGVNWFFYRTVIQQRKLTKMICEIWC